MRTTRSFFKRLTKDTYRFLANKKLPGKSSCSVFQGREVSYFCPLDSTFWINSNILKFSFLLLFSIYQNLVNLSLQMEFFSIVDTFETCESQRLTDIWVELCDWNVWFKIHPKMVLIATGPVLPLFTSPIMKSQWWLAPIRTSICESDLFTLHSLNWILLRWVYWFFEKL